MSRSDYKSSACTVSSLSGLHPLRAEQLIGKTIASVVADEFKLSLFFTDGTMMYAEGHTMSDSALDVWHCAADGANLPLAVEPFLLQYPALKGLSDCLKNTCQVIIDAANGLDVVNIKALKLVKSEALAKAKKAAKEHAKCNDVSEGEVLAMLKVELFLLWPILDNLARNLPEVTYSDMQFRDKVQRAVEDIDEYAIAHSKGGAKQLAGDVS